MKYLEQEDEKAEINYKRNRYPYCIVWTPLHPITAICPFIGHTGICRSDGIIHDFAGSNYVSEDDMAFGNPTKYVQLDIKDREMWDDCIKVGDEHYRNQEHDLCFNNCHSHVAFVLNAAGYRGGGWNMVYVALELVLKGRYTGFMGFLKTYLNFAIIFSLIALLVIICR